MSENYGIAATFTGREARKSGICVTSTSGSMQLAPLKSGWI